MDGVTRHYLNFLTEKCCGKCLPCRDGVRQILAMLQLIVQGKGRQGDIELIEELGLLITDISLCNVGKMTLKPLLATIRSFRDKQEPPSDNTKSGTDICKVLRMATAEPPTCAGCGLWAGQCPVDAVFASFRDEQEAHVTFTIEPEACTGCGVCAKKCPVNAIFTRAPRPGESAPKLREGRKLLEIDQSKCNKCGACFEACRFDAVRKE
jgi:NADH-quinone oxidoreductase subunit F